MRTKTDPRKTEALSSALSDETVVERVRSGERGLFEILMRRYNQRLFRVALSIVGDPDEAEDVMQEAYVRAFSHLEQYAGNARFATWLTKIAVYEALNRVRKRRRWSQLEGVHEGAEDRGEVAPLARRRRTPEDDARGRELRAVLERAVSDLPESHRLVFMLREVEGLSTDETAASLGIGSANVRIRLHRSRARLRSDLERAMGAGVRELFAFHLDRCDRVVDSVLAAIETEP